MLAVAAGGAVGSVARYVVATLAQQSGLSSSGFPWWTLGINVTGSFALGLFARYFVTSAVSPALFAALTLGLCGGYTTFSTFSYELLDMSDRGLGGRAVAYAVASVALSFIAVAIGAGLGRSLRT
ncbi:MAG: CrcB-like protein [Gemmatimonadetes bacterium]|nr:CrcB-like protein [Gemmatimonadota bacterium]